MSRARNIKPGFFKNELLVELPFEVRLLFIGLWTMCDRAGRMEDRPTKIRMEVFPADSVDVDAGLQSLHDAGFIQRYTADGKRYLQVLTWEKHQNPHLKEAKSVIPAYQQDVAPVEHCASTVQAPDEHQISTGVARLIPDSLIPDSLQELTEPNGSAAVAAIKVEPDPIWKTGLAFLRRKGIPEPQARAFLGKLKREAGDIDAAALLAQAEAEDITEPIPWLAQAGVNARSRPRAGPNGQPGKTLQGIQKLEALKNGNRLAAGGNRDGTAETRLLVAGSHAVV